MKDLYGNIDLETLNDRSKNYLKYAPKYPVEILNILRSDFGLNNEDVIADIGSGLGYLANLFLNESQQLYLVEKNRDNIDTLQTVFGSQKNVIIKNAIAENTNIDHESVDLILVGHSFHLFAPKPTKEEFLRIIKPNGLVCLVWHQINLEMGFQRDFEEMLKQYIPNYRNLSETHINLPSIDTFFDPYPFHFQKFPNFQIYDLEGIKGYFLSSGYTKESDFQINEAVLKEIEKLFNKHQQFNKIRFDYHTLVFIGKIR